MCEIQYAILFPRCYFSISTVCVILYDLLMGSVEWDVQCFGRGLGPKLSFQSQHLPLYMSFSFLFQLLFLYYFFVCLENPLLADSLVSHSCKAATIGTYLARNYSATVQAKSLGTPSQIYIFK